MRIVQRVPAKRHRHCHLCFVKGKLRHMEDNLFRSRDRDVVWPPMYGSNSCKEKDDFPPFGCCMFAVMSRETVPSMQIIFHLSEILFPGWFQVHWRYAFPTNTSSKVMLWYLKWKHSWAWRILWDLCLVWPTYSSAEHKLGATWQSFQKSPYLSADASLF